MDAAVSRKIWGLKYAPGASWVDGAATGGWQQRLPAALLKWLTMDGGRELRGER